MVDIDIDIWGYGRDAAQAGRLTERSLKASYAHIEAFDEQLKQKLAKIADEHLERNHYDQRVWLSFGNYIFFSSREDAEFIRVLLYVY